MKYIIAIDQSTTSTKCSLFNELAQIVADDSLIHEQFNPSDTWVEQDASEIYNNTVKLIKNVISKAKVDANDILSLAITCQTGAFVVWDKESGEPVHHIIGWQCNRGEEIVNSLSDKQKEIILKKTGTNASAYLPASKLAWMFKHIDGLMEKAKNGKVLFGTIESWLIWKLTKGKVHASDHCNASITQLYNEFTLDWDDEILNIFSVPKIMLPSLYDADALFGYIEEEGLPKLKITGVIGDSAAAMFGQCAFKQGDIKITYGTGSSILLNLGDNPQDPAEGMTTSVGWRMQHGKTTYVWEGTAVCTGAVIGWLTNDIKLINNPNESEEIAASIQDNGGVYLVPAFSGLGCPYNDPNARACIVGMSSSTKKAHIVRAALESIAYQIRDMVESMQNKTNEKVPYLWVDGGVTKNKLLMQFQADILGIPVIRSQAKESSALGVFYMSGLATGMFKDKEQLIELGEKKQRFEPKMSKEEREKLYQGWKKAINNSKI